MDGGCFGGESLLEKLNHLRRALRMQVRHQVSSAFRNVVSAGSGREIPMIAAGVLDRGAALTILMVCGWIKRSRAGRQRTFIDGIDVFDIEMEGGRGRRAFPPCPFATTANHDHRIANLVFRVITPRRPQPVDLAFGAKRLRHEFNLVVYIRYSQVGRNRAESGANGIGLESGNSSPLSTSSF